MRSTGSKAERARPVSASVEAGNVFLVRGTWNGEFLDEAEDFPGGGHDDQIDAVSGAIAVLTTSEHIFGPEDIAGAMSDEVAPLFEDTPQPEEDVRVFSGDVKPLFEETHS